MNPRIISDTIAERKPKSPTPEPVISKVDEELPFPVREPVSDGAPKKEFHHAIERFVGEI